MHQAQNTAKKTNNRDDKEIEGEQVSYPVNDDSLSDKRGFNSVVTRKQSPFRRCSSAQWCRTHKLPAATDHYRPLMPAHCLQCVTVSPNTELGATLLTFL